MADEREERQEERPEGVLGGEDAEKLDKADVDAVAGGQGKGGPIETPEIP